MKLWSVVFVRLVKTLSSESPGVSILFAFYLYFLRFKLPSSYVIKMWNEKKS